MASLEDFVALSLTPLSWRRDLGSDLRSGRPPGEMLDQLIATQGARRRHSARRYAIVDLRARAEAALALAQARRIAPLPWNDPDYPPALAAVHDPPPMLWTRGHRPVLASMAVAIVGSRAGSPYAIAVAERLAGELASRDVLVVSGLARGVDSAAHRGAVGTSGRTVAVLGSGVDVIYPREHAALADAVADRGLLLSELAPGTSPHPYFFPLRNRIISGLSRAVVVIEAGEKSGSLITARCALEQGRDVLAVPGNILTGRNRGGHALLRDGAKIVETADDILDELGADTMPSGTATTARAGPTGDALSNPVLRALIEGEPADLDVIADRTGMPASRLLPRLFELEMCGLVCRLGGGRFMRLDRSC